jgi:hypothetical protein
MGWRGWRRKVRVVQGANIAIMSVKRIVYNNMGMQQKIREATAIAGWGCWDIITNHIPEAWADTTYRRVIIASGGVAVAAGVLVYQSVVNIGG